MIANGTQCTIWHTNSALDGIRVKVCGVGMMFPGGLGDIYIIKRDDGFEVFDNGYETILMVSSCLREIF